MTCSQIGLLKEETNYIQLRWLKKVFYSKLIYCSSHDKERNNHFALYSAYLHPCHVNCKSHKHTVLPCVLIHIARLAISCVSLSISTVHLLYYILFGVLFQANVVQGKGSIGNSSFSSVMGYISCDSWLWGNTVHAWSTTFDIEG